MSLLVTVVEVLIQGILVETRFESAVIPIGPCPNANRVGLSTCNS